MTCKDCLKEDVCRYNDGHNLYCKEDYECPHFKNKADVVEVPDDTIIYIKNKWLVKNSGNENLSEAIKYCMDYLTKDARSEDNGKVY